MSLYFLCRSFLEMSWSAAVLWLHPFTEVSVYSCTSSQQPQSAAVLILHLFIVIFVCCSIEAASLYSNLCLIQCWDCVSLQQPHLIQYLDCISLQQSWLIRYLDCISLLKLHLLTAVLTCCSTETASLFSSIGLLQYLCCILSTAVSVCCGTEIVYILYRFSAVLICCSI